MGKHPRQRHPGSTEATAGQSPSVRRAHVEALRERGKSRDALEAAKQLFKEAPNPEAESLLVDAYHARIRALAEGGLAQEGRALAALVDERSPRHRPRTAPLLERSGLQGSGNLSALLAQVATPDPVRRRELEALVEGAILARDRLDDALRRLDIMEIPCLGKPFDPTVMRAVDVAGTPAHPPGVAGRIAMAFVALLEGRGPADERARDRGARCPRPARVRARMSGVGAAIILQDIKTLKRRLEPHLRRPRRAIAFGSVALGEADEWSDLDLLIVAETSRPFLERFKDFAGIYDVWPRLDLLIYTPREFEEMVAQENPLVLRALEEGVVLHEADSR